MLLRVIVILCLSTFISSCGEESKNEVIPKPVKQKNDKNSNKPKTPVDPIKKRTEVLFTTPTELVPVEEWPKLKDDIDFSNMELAIDRQLERFKQKNLKNTVIQMGQDKYPAQKIEISLRLFKTIIQNYFACLNSVPPKNCIQTFNVKVKTYFNMYRPKLESQDFGYNEENFARFTSYYTPLIEASKQKSETYPYAIYKKPPPPLRGLTRTEIDFDKKLENQGLELFYTEDLFELYLLHVQGGGKIRTLDKNIQKEYYISFAGTNQREWNFISIFMEKQGYINNRSIEAQREYLQNNPEKQKEIYSYCPSYIYFKISQTPPEGSDAVPLTDGRSIATDSQYYKFKGMLTYIEAKRPRSKNDKSMENFSRFFLDQDTGGAIKGKARIDLYHGEGEYAEMAAYNTDVRGKLYYFVVK
ncbi:MAG: MltA domain-containing protein [Bdellovibrionaceae bacterium]|nr:MltA domain-containing protein [Pseudobdellovibrionaceae bacterium]